MDNVLNTFPPALTMASGRSTEEIKEAYGSVKTSGVALRILRILEEGENRPSEISSELGSTISTVSEKLSALNTLGMVEKKPKEGRSQPYAMAKKGFLNGWNAHWMWAKDLDSSFFDKVTKDLDKEEKEKAANLVNYVSKAWFEKKKHANFEDIFVDVYLNGLPGYARNKDSPDWIKIFAKDFMVYSGSSMYSGVFSEAVEEI